MVKFASFFRRISGKKKGGEKIRQKVVDVQPVVSRIGQEIDIVHDPSMGIDIKIDKDNYETREDIEIQKRPDAGDGEEREVVSHDNPCTRIDMSGAIAARNNKKRVFKRRRGHRKSRDLKPSQQTWVFFTGSRSHEEEEEESGEDTSVVSSENSLVETSDAKHAKPPPCAPRNREDGGVKFTTPAAAANKRSTKNEDAAEESGSGATDLYTKFSSRIESWMSDDESSSSGGSSASTITYWYAFDNSNDSDESGSINTSSQSGSDLSSVGDGDGDDDDEFNSSSKTPVAPIMPQQYLPVVSRILQSQDDRIHSQALEIKRLQEKEKEQARKHLQAKLEAERLLNKYEMTIARMAVATNNDAGSLTPSKRMPSKGSSTRSVSIKARNDEAAPAPFKKMTSTGSSARSISSKSSLSSKSLSSSLSSARRSLFNVKSLLGGKR